jgi:UDP-N-acetylmuramoyl-L-alanyl-D-glutamate--2,6-diaminopimelate ligase
LNVAIISQMVKNIDDLRQNIGQFKGITTDSRLVKAGFIFVATRGITSDGHDFIKNAIESGATAIVGDKDLMYPNYVKVADSREALGNLASDIYGNPSEKLKIIGVTGTKGKTTTVHIIHHILTKLGYKAGLISSISVPGLHVTSPDVISLHKTLREFVDKGYKYAVIEVSSHGIDQKRIAGVTFDVAVLTNIAPEHLDYHKTFAEYKRVKKSFLKSAKYKIIAPEKTDIKILPGVYNNLNIEAGIMALEKFGINRKDAIDAVKSFELPEGRLTEITNNLGYRIFIDFAHTPDSLEAALTYLKSQVKGKLISVFGCAGERDRKKRYQMAKVSVKMSDISVFTAEDPRSENIGRILSKMAEGAKNAGGKENETYFRIPERGEAIAFAISKAQKGDIIGIFGKGHEKSLAYNGFEHPWSDAEAVRNILSAKDDISAIILAAGRGTRMKSTEPKVLRKICGKPMISYTLENLRKAEISDITVVVRFRKNLVIKEIGRAVKFAVQKMSKGGTADAAKAGFAKISDKSKTLVVINGDDSAFYKSETVKNILRIHTERKRKLTFVSLIKNDPTGLGRVVRGENGLITKVVEEKDATETERKIKEVNDGLYVFDRSWFEDNINKVKRGPQGEYYLVDIIKLSIDQGDRMATYTLPDDDEWQGVNTPEQLEEANKKMAKRLISNG